MRWPSSDHALAEPIQARRMSTATIACFILPSFAERHLEHKVAAGRRGSKPLGSLCQKNQANMPRTPQAGAVIAPSLCALPMRAESKRSVSEHEGKGNAPNGWLPPSEGSPHHALCPPALRPCA
jgi:hypothetical protein